VKCGISVSRKLIRDDKENVPQPGFIGSNYWTTRVALAGQNPAVGQLRFGLRDAAYTAALRALRKTPDETTMSRLNTVLLDFIPEWPIHGNYFPLRECGLDLQDIAYFNVVRCRTQGNSVPGAPVLRNCLGHFDRWLDLLRPKVLVFIGKWASDKASHLAATRCIPTTYMNRERSLSSGGRAENRAEVVAFVQSALGQSG
jgi:hypothetical protein